ncbi:helix-turn-helix transcriptional regulator [Curtobacterium sp. MCBD17_030]|uniref:ArsR/SmtB family transcription factor n=1 Tax=Curtobacterium sp. MCBD17_030 TaxID=2175649 RepID=UPI000D8E248C|nr:metalloregulator ArsR/SmtB family transcription factor [Curtobacterium sp. MCBD17_030]PYY32480.1 transcriptional regulator [Curtobacterium sp. MCBD17_030]
MSNEEPKVGHDPFPLPAVDDLELVRVLRAAGDPTRLVIIERLSDGDYHPCNLTDYRLDIHKTTLSHHFKVLRESGLTRTRVTGREHAVQLRRDALEARWPGLLDTLVAAAVRDDPGAQAAPEAGAETAPEASPAG